MVGLLAGQGPQQAELVLSLFQRERETEERRQGEEWKGEGQREEEEVACRPEGEGEGACHPGEDAWPQRERAARS